MKNKILLFILLLGGNTSYAQWKFGFTTGAQLANVRLSTYNTDSRFTFNLGGAAITSLSEDISLHFQLLLSSKGYKYYDVDGFKHTVKPLYLELPVVARFKFKTSENTDVYVGVGAFYAFGIGGKQTYYFSGVKESQKIKFGNGEDDGLRQSDYGVVFQLGADFRENFEGHFFYDLGVANILPDATTNTFNRVFGFNLTWYFQSKKEKE